MHSTPFCPMYIEQGSKTSMFSQITDQAKFVSSQMKISLTCTRSKKIYFPKPTNNNARGVGSSYSFGPQGGRISAYRGHSRHTYRGSLTRSVVYSESRGLRTEPATAISKSEEAGLLERAPAMISPAAESW